MTVKTFKPIESTQQLIPIRDIIGDVVITDKNKFVKVLEVKPIPFDFKKISEQNKISNIFRGLLKSGPANIHIKSMAVQADLSAQITNIESNIANMTNENMKNMAYETLDRLYEAQEYGVTRKFYFSFPYAASTTGFRAKTTQEILYQLDREADSLRNMFASCGNEVVRNTDERTAYNTTKLLYEFYNRDHYLQDTFDDRIAEVIGKYERETGSFDSYIRPQDYIAPLRISFDEESYLLVNDTYYTFLYIPGYGYNREVITGWLDNLVTLENGVDVDIFLKKMQREQVIRKIRRALGQSRSVLMDASDASDTHDVSSAVAESSMYLKEGLSSGEDFYYVSTIITVSGKSPKEVEEKIDELKKSASRCDITLHQNKNRLEETFKLVLPFAMWDDNSYTLQKTRRNVLTSGAASFYNFTSFQIRDPKGLYIADDFSGSPVIVDFFNRRNHTNPAIFVSGESGAGKSTFLDVSILRFLTTYYNDGGFVMLICPEKESEARRICDAVGGQFISFGSGSPNRLNIMEIFMKDTTALEDSEALTGVNEFATTSYLSEKISSLMEFFSMHVSDITLEEKTLLNDALIKTYENFGITSNNESLFADKSRTKYKVMPIISDLVKVLESNKDSVRLARVIRLLTTGAGAHFDGKTNVNINNRFCVIGLEHNTKDMLGLSIYAAMEHCWAKVRENIRIPKQLIFDEWWKLAYNPIAAERSLQLSKLARSQNCQLIFATQQLSDILAVENGKYGNAVLNNCDSKFLFSMKEQDAQIVADFVGLNQREIEPLGKFRPGQALMLTGNSTMAVNIKLTPTEQMLIFTDAETIDKYVEMKKQENAIDEPVQPEEDELEGFEFVSFDEEENNDDN